MRTTALNLIKKSLDFYKQIVSGPQYSIEGELERYRNELRRITQRWLDQIVEEDADDLGAEIYVLIVMLQNAARRHLVIAYKLGLGGRPLTEDDLRNIDRALASNWSYLTLSFAPDIEARIWEIREDGYDFLSAIELATAFALARVSLYAGAFWTILWVALGEALERVLGRGAKGNTPVERLLSPADHCATCPPKAGFYPSWNAMLLACGGLPADGSDNCLSNCRCYLRIFYNGNWMMTI